MCKLKKYISQTQCQIKSFKIQIKIFVIIISVLLLSCDYNKNKESKNTVRIRTNKYGHQSGPLWGLPNESTCSIESRSDCSTLVFDSRTDRKTRHAQ